MDDGRIVETYTGREGKGKNQLLSVLVDYALSYNSLKIAGLPHSKYILL